MSENKPKYEEDIIPPMEKLPEKVMTPQLALETMTKEAKKFGDTALTLYTLFDYRANQAELEVSSMQMQIDSLQAMVDHLMKKIAEMEGK